MSASSDEHAQLDAEDESLARGKASLGIPTGGEGPAPGPKVTIYSLQITSSGLASPLTLDIQDKDALARTKEDPLLIKDGAEYNVNITFKVNHGSTSGIRYIQVVKRSGIKVDKIEHMLGSYGYQANGEAYTTNFDAEEAPSGMLARSFTYAARSRVVDNDGNVYADFEWWFKISKDWKS